MILATSIFLIAFCYMLLLVTCFLLNTTCYFLLASFHLLIATCYLLLFVQELLTTRLNSILRLEYKLGAGKGQFLLIFLDQGVSKYFGSCQVRKGQILYLLPFSIIGYRNWTNACLLLIVLYFGSMLSKIKSVGAFSYQKCYDKQ